jgi:hypothetical protein
MNPMAKKVWFHKGISLVEIMVSITALSVALIGASSFRYYSALDARRANIQTGGIRVGLLLCETWKGVKGGGDYDPVTCFSSELATVDAAIDVSSNEAITNAIVAEGFTILGTYTIVANNVTYYAVLSWKDISAELRALNVGIVWEPRGKEITSTTDISELKLFRLTTYTSN